MSTRRRPLFCGNWKLFGSKAESVSLAKGVMEGTADVGDADVAVSPGFVALDAVAQAISGGKLGLSAQNCHWEPKGAFTGEAAPAQLKDIGCAYVIVGHSERRQYFGETDETVSKKVQAVLGESLSPVVCVGETLEERDAGNTIEVVKTQIEGALAGVSAEQMPDVVVAYEPVWAIGTGRTATAQQAAEVHAAIRAQLTEKFGDVGQNTRILYGGSVKPANVAELMAEQDVDGALVGGASLTVESFVTLVKEGTASWKRS